MTTLESPGRPPGLFASRPLLVSAFAAGMGLRLLSMVSSVGTTDIAIVTSFAELMAQFGLAETYQRAAWLNHPPLGASLFALSRAAARALNLELATVFRLLQIAADAGTAAGLAVIGRRLHGHFGLALLYLLSPVAIFVSGFHGNSDPAMGFFVVLGALLLIRPTPRPAAAGLALALATGIKVVPLLLVPVIAAALAKERWRFLGAYAGGFAVLFAPLAAAPGALKNIFFYSGLGNWWGIPALAEISRRAGAPASMGRLYGAITPFVIVALVTLLTLLVRRTSRDFVFLIAIPTLLLLLIFFGSGFGVQYLLWPAALLPLATGYGRAIFYHAAAACFLFSAYTVWSGGWPWVFADSSVSTPDWLVYSGLAVWTVIGYCAVRGVTELRRSKS